MESAVRSNYSPLEIIVVDNDSRDSSLAEIWSYLSFSNLKLIRNAKNFGLSEGYNIGARAISQQSKYLVFLNHDIVLDPSCILQWVKTMEGDRSIGACEGLVSIAANPGYVSAPITLVDYLGFEVRPPDIPAEAVGTRSREIFSVLGVAMMIRTAVATELGLFDPAIFIGFEATDLCWRLWICGYRVMSIGNARVTHVARFTRSLENPFETLYDPSDHALSSFHTAKNQLMTLLKNYSSRNVVRYLPATLLVRSGEIIYLLIRRNPLAQIKARAVLWNLRNFHYIYQQRLVVQRNRRVSDSIVRRLMTPPNLLRLTRTAEKFHSAFLAKASQRKSRHFPKG